jgi:regulator of protease activity HflC (stomatin/prohibitin superfamily)
MGVLWQFLVDLITEIWPLRHVSGWETGIRTWCNRPKAEKRPGIYLVIPLFGDILTLTTVPYVTVGSRQDITLKDGTPLNFAASAWVQVTDATKARFNVDEYEESTTEIMEAVLAERLAEVDVERFETVAKRRNFLKELASIVDEQTQEFGVTVERVWFSNFSLKLKTFRALIT